MAVVATTQQSRFHTETRQADCEDVDLKQLNLTIDDHELLTDTELRLFAGVRYGLIGANGTGKSTLLRAVGDGLVVGFPANLHALYVDQLGSSTSDEAIWEHVAGADKQVVGWRRQAKLLQDAFEAPTQHTLADTVKQVRLELLGERVAAAALINEHRSGDRGRMAREALLELEARLHKAEEACKRQPTAAEARAAPQAGQELLQSLMQRLNLAQADAAEASARKILLGLGFSRAVQDQPLTSLSGSMTLPGGWQMRAALAKALFLEPDILLLDEPTNFLDLPSIIWFQTYLRALTDKIVVVISHDRAFLDAVAQKIIHLRHKKLAYHDGNYSEFRQAADESRQHSQRLQEGIDKKKSRLEKSIQENFAKAKKAGDDKKLKQVASKQRKLDERAGLEKNDKGHRFRINKDMGGYYLSTRRDIELDVSDSVPAWKLPEPVAMRTAGPLVQLDAVSFAYASAEGSQSTQGRTPKTRRSILRDVTLCVDQKSRIALVGPNGRGKSTLVKLVLGELREGSGSISRHAQARVGVFAQDIVEQLIIDKAESSALKYMADMHPGAKEQELRKHLGSFGLKGSTATQKLGTLSGGQAVRVQLAAIAYCAPNFLVLVGRPLGRGGTARARMQQALRRTPRLVSVMQDEPSSHLDMLSIDALTSCLATYAGAVLLVSHDRHLVSAIANQVYLVDDCRIQLLENGIGDYVRQLKKQHHL